MLIYFVCPKCQAKLEVEADAAETQLPCPHCGEAIRVPRKILGPGITIGGFRIIRQIGCGAMGEVYLARQLSMGRDVALKILPARVTLRPQLVDRFLQEVRMQARLEHPYIVTAHEAGEDEGVYYMAMAYVKGEALDRVIHREGPVEERRTLGIVHKIASALAYAWEEHRILHRDIKPSNIIMDHHGQPKLTDLGLSKSLDDGEGLTITEMVMGTPNYMSPEQAAGSREVDFRSDMYSLGMTMYHMLTGNLPYAGASAMDTLRKQATESLPDPRDINKNISSACVALMQIMLSKDSAGRHSTWEALIGDIDRVLHGQHPTRRPLAEGESAILRLRDARRTSFQRTWPGRAAGILIAAVIVLILLRLVKRPDESSTPPSSAETVSQVEPAEQIEAAVRDPRSASQPDFPKPPGRRPPHDDRGPAPPKHVRPEKFAPPAGDSATVLEVIADLEARAQHMSAEGSRDEAIHLLRAYDGYMAAETREWRMNLAASMERQAQLEEEERLRERERSRALKAEFLDELAGLLLSADYERALRSLDEPLPETMSFMDDPEVEVARHVVQKIPQIEDLILQSFEEEIGQMVRIAFHDGTQILRIDRVGLRSIEGRMQLPGTGFAGRRFVVDDLSLLEKVKRLKRTAQSPQADIMCGLLFYHEQRYPAALTAFRRSETTIGDSLVERIEQRFEGARNVEAERLYGALLRTARLPLDARPDAVTLAHIRNLELPPHQMERLKRGAERFRASFRQTDTWQRAEPIVNEMLAIRERSAVPMPAEYEDLFRELRMVNPEAVGLLPVARQTEEGLEVDLSENPGLKDLSPLRNLPIRKLNLNSTGVSNLMPLVGMPLTELQLWDTPVTDVTPLRAMFELEYLNLATPSDEVQVTDISPLRQLRLKKLDLFGCGIKDIRALSQMKLEWLKIEKTAVSDLSPLKGMPLKSLNISRTQVSDLSALKGMTSLEHLDAEACPISNISPLRTMQNLQDLDLSWTRVENLDALGNLPLKRLRLIVTPISNLGPLAESPIEELDIRHCWALSDLNALRRMPGLTILRWNDAAQANLMRPVMEAVSKQDFDTARLNAEKIIAEFSSVPAMREFLKTVQRFVDHALPLWRDTLVTLRENPRQITRLALELDGHLFLCIPSFVDYGRAVQIAERLGGHLATVTSAPEHTWIAEHFAVPGTAVWLGASDEQKKGKWKWVTGEPFQFSAWAPGQPDNSQGKEHHLSMDSEGDWNDLSRDTPLPFLVEWPPPAQ